MRRSRIPDRASSRPACRRREAHKCAVVLSGTSGNAGLVEISRVRIKLATVWYYQRPDGDTTSISACRRRSSTWLRQTSSGLRATRVRRSGTWPDHQIGALRIYDAVANSGIRAIAIVPFLTGSTRRFYHSIVAGFYALFGKTVDVAQWANLPALALLYRRHVRYRPDGPQTFARGGSGDARRLLSAICSGSRAKR